MFMSTYRFLAVALASFLSIFNSHACDVAVHATSLSEGSVSVFSSFYYTKKFDVSIVNLSENTIDLNLIHLRAYSPEGKSFKLHTVEESLFKGILKPMKIAKGFAVFSSEDDSVYLASMIKPYGCDVRLDSQKD